MEIFSSVVSTLSAQHCCFSLTFPQQASICFPQNTFAVTSQTVHEFTANAAFCKHFDFSQEILRYEFHTFCYLNNLKIGCMQEECFGLLTV